MSRREDLRARGISTEMPPLEWGDYLIDQKRYAEARAALLNYRSQAPHAARAHPTEDHFLPLFFALGAAGDDLRANYLSREVMYGMLAMDAFALQDE